VHHFTGPDPGIICAVAPYINGNLSPFDFLKANNANVYCQHYSDRDKLVLAAHSKQTDITVDEIYCFIAPVILMGRDNRDTIKERLLVN
jgi:hypothetical protein